MGSLNVLGRTSDPSSRLCSQLGLLDVQDPHRAVVVPSFLPRLFGRAKVRSWADSTHRTMGE